MREHLLDAAELVIAGAGIDGATVEAVAAEAGVSRSTVYRAFDNRDEMILGVVGRAAQAFGETLRHRVVELDELPLADLIVETMADVVRMGREPGLNALFVGHDRDVVESLIRGTGTVAEIAHVVLLDVLELLTPEQRRDLRDDVELNEVARWLVHVGLMLITGTNEWSTDPEQTRLFLERFVVPSIVRARP